MHADGTATQREPMDVWVVSKDFSSSKGLLKEVASCCEELAPLDPGFAVDAQQTCITVPETGKTITALPCSGAACRGKTGAVIGDEIAFWRQQQDVYGAAKLIADPNLGERRGYPVLWITTPWEEGSLAHRLFTEESPSRRPHSVNIYQAVEAGFPIDPLVAFEELGIPELIDTEYLCKWARGGASFFPIAKLRDCQVDDEVILDSRGRPLPDSVIKCGLPKGWEHAPCVIGIDVGGGRGRDFTAAVQWREIAGHWWMVGLKAFNNLDVEEQADLLVAWILGIPDDVRVEIRVDRGMMGLDLIALMAKRLKHRKRVSVNGVGFSPADQERYAKAGKRALERGRMHLYTGSAAGGDEGGVRALMLELSQLKTRPGEGGHLTFTTPRDNTGHRDRGWAALIGISDVPAATGAAAKETTQDFDGARPELEQAASVGVPGVDLTNFDGSGLGF